MSDITPLLRQRNSSDGGRAPIAEVRQTPPAVEVAIASETPPPIRELPQKPAGFVVLMLGLQPDNQLHVYTLGDADMASPLACEIQRLWEAGDLPTAPILAEA